METREKNTGGPAFVVAGHWGLDSSGMTLRDHFAGLALQGYMVALKNEQDISPERQDAVAQGMYSMADAMLKARQ